MEDAISRDKLLYEVDLMSPLLPKSVIKELIEEMPSIKPKAYRIIDEDGNMKCSVCGSSECWGNYCMHCGSKMEDQ